MRKQEPSRANLLTVVAFAGLLAFIVFRGSRPATPALFVFAVLEHVGVLDGALDLAVAEVVLPAPELGLSLRRPLVAHRWSLPVATRVALAHGDLLAQRGAGVGEARTHGARGSRSNATPRRGHSFGRGALRAARAGSGSSGR